MLFYKGNGLIKTAAKIGGKNKSDEDGFYQDKDGREFFIKKPKDEKELFTELFAGLFLKELMNRGLIDEAYFASLICADLITFEDGSYGLIQPKIAFTELYKIIGTGYTKGSDRDPLMEMLVGPSYYPALTQQGHYFGLSISLMFSLLLGDYSVHSGNVVILEAPPNIKSSNAHFNATEKKEPLPVKQFGRIDWGAAFRYFAHPENNQNILNPYEYHGWLNYKWFTKGYISNYKNVIGLFSAIADKAMTLKRRLEYKPGVLEEIVNHIFSQIPANLLAPQTKTELAQYLSIPAFAKVNFGQIEGYQEVAAIFGAVLESRLEKITNLKKKDAQSKQDLNPQSIYQSVIFNRIQLEPTVLSIEPGMPFPDQLTLWLNLFKEEKPLDFTKINLADLTKQFNLYIELLAHQTEIFNLWDHESHTNINMFAPYHKGTSQAILGNAFVAQYRESTILRRLFSLNLESAVTTRFAPYELPTLEYKKDHQGSLWSHIETVLNRGYDVITYLNLLKKFQNSSDKDLNNSDLTREHFTSLKQGLEQFVQASKNLNKQLESCPIKLESGSRPSGESLFFYPVSDNELRFMNGDQLVTICLEELYAAKPSSLLIRLIKNDGLWEKIQRAYLEGNFNARADNSQNKMRLLEQWHKDFLEFQLQKNNFDSAENLNKKQLVFKDLVLSYENLPSFLIEDQEISAAFNQREKLLVNWQKSNEFYLNQEKAFLQASIAAERVAVYSKLETAFSALPVRLKEFYQVRQQRYQRQVDVDAKEMAYLQCLADLNNQTTVAKSCAFLNKLRNVFEQLPPLNKVKYQDEFDKLYANNYYELLQNKVILGHEPIRKINAVLQSLQADNYLAAYKEAVFTDLIFWQAIATSKGESISAEVVHDLLVVKAFYESKRKPQNDKILGREYNQSLDLFYQSALKIRLLPIPIQQQVEAITNVAHSLFRPRHNTRRLLADALMVISVLFAGLGLAIMARRHSKHKPIFFSQEVTRREDELTKKWLAKNASEEGKKEETCLFNLPIVTVKA